MTGRTVEIYVTDPAARCHALGEVRVQVPRATVLGPAPTVEEVDRALRVRARQLGATAVINVQYRPCRLWGLWPALMGCGIGVIFTDR